VIRTLLAATALSCVLAAAATANPLPTYNLVLGDGADAVATYIGFEAADTDSVELAMSGTPFFVNNTTPMGKTHDLGVAASGAEIPFELMNLTDSLDYFTGPGSRNADGDVHAFVGADPTGIYGFAGLSPAAQAFAVSLEAPGTVFVGFEDLPGAQSDFDYNDLVFAVREAIPGVVDEPAAMALLGTALLGFGMWRQSRT
jgi:hypothetical protein